MIIDNERNYLIIMLCLVSWASSVSAHHSSSPHFDSEKPVSISGVVTEFKLVNPHAYLYVDVADKNGVVTNWNCEMNAASSLKRNGWTKEALKPGTKVTLNGSAARRDPHGCAFADGEYGDGIKFTRGGTMSAVVQAAAVDQAISTVANSVSMTGLWQTKPRVRNAPAGAERVGERPGAAQAARSRLGRYADSVTAAGEAAADGYDMRFDDPALFCSPSSIVRGWSEPNGVSRVTVGADQVLIEHEFMDTKRTIYPIGTQQAAAVAPDFRGYSTGRFEGNVLSIETRGFPAGVLVPHPGIMHSEELVVTETLTLSEDGNELVREYSATDPTYLKEPITGSNAWVRTTIALPDYNCEELGGINNARPD